MPRRVNIPHSEHNRIRDEQRGQQQIRYRQREYSLVAHLVFDSNASGAKRDPVGGHGRSIRGTATTSLLVQIDADEREVAQRADHEEEDENDGGQDLVG